MIQLLFTIMILQFSRNWAYCRLVNPVHGIVRYVKAVSLLEARCVHNSKISSLKSSVEDTTVDYGNSGDNLGLAGATKSALKIGYKFSRPHTIKVFIYLMQSCLYENLLKTFYIAFFMSREQY